MIQIRHLTVIFLFLSGLIFIPACSDEDTIDPANDRDQFLGSWDVSENCTKVSYTVEIIADPSNSSQVLIKNFWLIGYSEKPPYAIVAGSTITIPKQWMCDNASNEVTGSGKLKNNKIEWDYTVNDGADLHTCTAVYERP